MLLASLGGSYTASPMARHTSRDPRFLLFFVAFAVVFGAVLMLINRKK